MKLINSSEISLIFNDLMNRYDHYKWAVAWAGADFDQIENLEKNIIKIDKIIIGIHFYQTHPDFIKKFYKHEHVKFILKPSGIFHPKIYLFENSSDDWSVIIGSHNFTNSAFNSNSEVSILLTSKDITDNEFKRDIDNYILKSWDQSESINEDELINYCDVFAKQMNNLRNLSRKTKKSIHKDVLLLEIIKMSWDEYYLQVKQNEHHERIKLLDTAHNLYIKYKSFNSISLLDRKGISGFYDNNKDIDGFNWFAFGSMKGAGYFKGEIIKSNPHISDALDYIPIIGDINRNDFMKFAKKYIKSINNSKNPIATATRLLTMKRPDYFFCFNSKNRKDLTKAFEIKESLNLNEYWDFVLEKIYASDWWNDTSLKTNIELKTFNYRVAFIDNLYFEEF